jgi:hypothetical protein
MKVADRKWSAGVQHRKELNIWATACVLGAALWQNSDNVSRTKLGKNWSALIILEDTARTAQ